MKDFSRLVTDDLSNTSDISDFKAKQLRRIRCSLPIQHEGIYYLFTKTMLHLCGMRMNLMTRNV